MEGEDSDLTNRLKSHLCIDFIGLGISLIQIMISSSPFFDFDSQVFRQKRGLHVK